MRRALAIALLLAGCDSGFSVGVDVEPSCLAPPATLTVRVVLRPQGEQRTRQVADAPGFLAGDHRVVVIPPAGTTGVDVRVDALDVGGGLLGTGSVSVPVSGNQLAEDTLALAGDACAPDLGNLGDAPPPPDLAQPPCTGDQDCGGATPRCDLMTGRCEVCLPSADNCPMGQHCIPQGGGYVCAPGCSTGNQCGALPNDCCGNLCVDTSQNDQNCGACGKPCATGNSCCGSVCIDTSSDPKNCGGCGLACAIPNATAKCAMGQCVVGTCSANWGDCDHDGKSCETLLVNNPSNCGACGNKCASGTHCIGVQCGKRVFATAGVFPAAMGGASGADTKCQNAADSQNLGGTWKAWLSTTSTPAALRLNLVNVPYFRLDNQEVVGSGLALKTSGGLLAPIEVNELRGPVGKGTACSSKSGTPVWTGTDPGGVVTTGGTCADWTGTSTTVDGAVGNASTASTPGWTDYCAGAICAGTAALYCIEQ